MNCSCGGETKVTESRMVEGALKRRRKCLTCNGVFYTQEVFLYKSGENPNKKTPSKKQYFTKPEAEGIKRKRVETRRKLEDIKQERKQRVPNYFIEEEDW